MYQRLNQVLDHLKIKLPGFETREEQYEMMKTTYDAMSNGHKIAIHAPTGTGKSLGYLIPYVAVKLDNADFTLSISTFTKDLQNQLRTDIELINEIYINIKLEEDIKVDNLNHVTLMGKSNYFCKKKYEEAKENNEISLAIIDLLDGKIKDIVKKESDLNRKNINISLGSDWEKINVEKCDKVKCEHRHKCTYFQHYFTKKNDIYIVNHSLFFLRHFFVEPWDVDFNVFDEAHKLEKVILECYTFELSTEKIENWVRQGANLSVKYGTDQNEVNLWIQHYLYKHELINKFRKGIKSILEGIKNAEATANKSNDNKIKNITYEKVGFIVAGFRNIVRELRMWQKEMYDSVSFNTFTAQVDNEKKFKEDKESWMLNLLELMEFSKVLEDPNSLLWIDRNERDNIYLKVTPKNIHDIESPFVKGLLFTSGTLSENNTCTPFADRLKVDLDKDLVLPTPFNLSKQTMAYISRNINPKAKDVKEYEALLEKEIWDLLVSGEFKTFILFTSESMMKKMHERIQPKIKSHFINTKENVEVWVQEENNHKNIMESFRNTNTRSVLFGTLGYFEGIDLKGETLTQIILTRLPYAVPTHPIQEILDSHASYSEWEAMIRFEQAFGRLIRSFNDYGTFSILDNRIYNQKNTKFLKLFTSEKIQTTNRIEDLKQFYDEMKTKEEG